ncbi:hypothetical protein D3C85_1575010 [compost metagenome]
MLAVDPAAAGSVEDVALEDLLALAESAAKAGLARVGGDFGDDPVVERDLAHQRA